MSTFSRTIGWSSAIIIIIIAVAACSSGSSSSSSASTAQANVKCTSDTTTLACFCEANAERQLSTTIVEVEGCGEAPAEAPADSWECCHDRDTSSYTTKCECAAWRCIQHSASDGGGCQCSFFAETTGGNTAVDSCTGAVCVKTEDECVCSDDPNTRFGFGETVSSCANAKPSTFCRALPFSTPSCKSSGITWKPPPTPRAPGDCIRNGNACGPAKQANGNCCSGYCGENGTCEQK